MSSLIVLSHIQVAPLLDTTEPSEVWLSLDLNRTQQQVQRTAAGLTLPDGQHLSWPQLEEIASNENACYHIHDNTAEKISFFSPALQRAYTLYPTHAAPTMLISGITMHRIVACDPHQDTQQKIKAMGKLTGPVLDTTMGLGYTAIAAAHTAASVITIEIDPTVVDVCQRNPWSQALFTAPNITQRLGHAWDVIEDEFSEGQFQAIIHDPPMLNMAGDLYAADFYRELHRILKPKGRLFHYIGNPQRKSGATVTRGVIKRLQTAGFQRVVSRPQAFGVVAFK